MRFLVYSRALQAVLTQCASPALMSVCQDMEVVQFINSMLGYACSPQNREEFFLSFECIHMQIKAC